MNIKNKLIGFFIFSSILTLSVLNVKNPEKTKFYLFTSKIEKISLGNLISITFLTGIAFGSLLTFLSENNLQKSIGDNFINDEKNDKSDENDFSQEFQPDRPPERDVRDAQPTISVNYRFVDQDNNLYGSKNTKKTNDILNKDENDWANNDDEW